MNPITAAQRLLERNPGLSLSLQTLHNHAALQGAEGPPSCLGFGQFLHRHPDRFRVLNPWSGSWTAGLAAWLRDRAKVATSPTDDAIVVLLPGSDREPARPQSLPARQRQCLGWLGRSVDDGSPRDIARWARLADSCGRTQQGRAGSYGGAA